MWVYVFKKYRKFDNTCTTPALALAQISGVLAVMGILLCAFNAVFIPDAFLLLALFVFLNRRFLRLVIEKEGLIFALASIPLELILACAIVLGASWAFFDILCRNVFKRNCR
jgi:hypothetical protein